MLSQVHEKILTDTAFDVDNVLVNVKMNIN